MAMQLLCTCGKQLRIADEYAGRQVKCPSCGKVQIAPKATGVTAAAPPPPAKSSGYGLALLLVLLLVAATVGGWWWLTRGKGGATGDVTDLSLIPADAQGFVSLRLADLWATPAVKQVLEDARKRDPKTPDLAAEMESVTSLRPEDVERVSFAGMNLEQRIGWGIAKTVKPYDRDTILHRLNHHRERFHDGKSYFIGVDRQANETALFFVNPTLLVFGTDDGVKAAMNFLTSPKRNAEGPLTPVLKRCDEPKYKVVLGVHPSPDATKSLQGNEAAAVISELRLGQLTVDVEKEAVIDVRVETTGEAQAKKVHATINDYLGKGKAALFFLSFKGGEQGKAAAQLSKLLGQLKLEQQGNDLAATITTDPAALAPALLMLPSLVGR